MRPVCLVCVRLGWGSVATVDRPQDTAVKDPHGRSGNKAPMSTELGDLPTCATSRKTGQEATAPTNEIEAAKHPGSTMAPDAMMLHKCCEKRNRISAPWRQRCRYVPGSTCRSKVSEPRPSDLGRVRSRAPIASSAHCCGRVCVEAASEKKRGSSCFASRRVVPLLWAIPFLNRSVDDTRSVQPTKSHGTRAVLCQLRVRFLLLGRRE